jgi:YD repeat-containing protein
LGSQAVAQSAFQYDTSGRLTAIHHRRGDASLAHYALGYDDSDASGWLGGYAGPGTLGGSD